MYIKNVTDNWKELFENAVEEPTFYATRATIFISTSNSNKLIYNAKIEIYDDCKQNHTIIIVYTNKFSADIMEPEFDEDKRWSEQNFEALTQPIIFDEPSIDVHLNNNGTEDWYEFILYPKDYGDKIASINVRSFEIALV